MTDQIFTSLYLARADVFLAVAALALLAVGVCIKTRAFQKIAILAVPVLFVTGMMMVQQDNDDLRLSLFNDMILYDRYGVFMKCLVLLGGMAAIFMGVRDLAGHVHGRFEFVILVLLSAEDEIF